MRLQHNPYRERFRTPLGAMPTKGQVRICVEAEGECAVQFVAYGEGVLEKRQMQRQGALFCCTFCCPEEPVVLWYHFEVYGEGRQLFLGRNEAGEGAELVAEYPRGFQLTVYDAAFVTPDFFKKGVLYQIFPDRFASSKTHIAPAKRYHEGMGRRVILRGEGELPLYQPLPGARHYQPCDYFGGDLPGIERALPYLAELGVSILYLNPIFEADSNHRYNTADYRKIDPFLGTEADFSRLVHHAQALGIKIILDGVFSHTGADSVYFNKKGNYGTMGAYQSPHSPYAGWYRFFAHPDRYACWWGFDSLPEVEEHNRDWQAFMIEGADSVIRRWIKKGAAGWRLDVADELPDDVICKMRAEVKREDAQALLLGEVWEDATTKESYGKRRTYALGRALDSVMNYPLRNAILAYLLGGSAWDMVCFLRFQQNAYPRPMLYCLMNLLSSHDVERMRTVLARRCGAQGMDREAQAHIDISPAQDAQAARLLKLAFVLIMSIPGMPSIYYGDETGMHGLKDPFNRGFFTRNDRDMERFVARLSRLRRAEDALMTGHAAYFEKEGVLGILRVCAQTDAFSKAARPGVFLTLINTHEEQKPLAIAFDEMRSGMADAVFPQIAGGCCRGALLQTPAEIAGGAFTTVLPPCSAEMYKCKER